MDRTCNLIYVSKRPAGPQVRGRARFPPVTALRIAEAARLLGVSDDTVRRWIDGGSCSNRSVFVIVVRELPAPPWAFFGHNDDD